MRKTIGVAFGGGGARGPAHIGVIKALRQTPELCPSIVAGTSAGSIAATMYAAEVVQEEMERTALEFDWFRDVIRFSDTVRMVIEGEHGGLVSNKRLGERINGLIHGRGFDQLQTDLAICATDIDSQTRVIFTSPRVAQRIDSGELEHFLPPPVAGKPGYKTVVISDYHDIGQAVRASCAVPGIFTPVRIRGMRLVDGGVLDQVPVDVVRAMGADITVGISLALSYAPDRLTKLPHVLGAMVGMMGIHQLRRSLDLADIGFQITGIDQMSPLRAHQPDLIALGESDMTRHIPTLTERVQALNGAAEQLGFGHT